MNIKDAYVHVGPSGTNEKALLKDFAITAAQITLTRAIQNDAGTGDKTENITIPIWNQSTTGNAATASALSVIKSTAATEHYLTFVDSNNNSAANENFYTTANISIVPSTGKITMDGMNSGLVWKVNYLSGWARDFIAFSQHTNNDSNAALSTVFKIGSYGDTDGYIYTYIGGNNYDGSNLRFNKDGSITIGTNKVWHAGNDGTGSGLDADLLDGQHLSDLDARYVLKAGDTMTGALTVPSLSVTGAATFSQAINGSILGNAATASRLQNARNIAISGAVTGNANFDGSGDITISTSVNHTHNYAGSGSAGGAATNVVVNSGNNSSSTYPLVWHSGNTLYSTAEVYCNPSTDVVYAKAFYASGGQPGFQITTTATNWSYIRINNGSNFWDIASKSNNESGRLEFRYGGADTAKAGVDVAGNLFSTANGNTLKIGSLNANYCHFQNSADIPFYFNKTVSVDGVFKIYNTSYQINSSTSVLNDLRVSGDDLYIGSASGSQCHQQYDSTNKVLKFIFD